MARRYRYTKMDDSTVQPLVVLEEAPFSGRFIFETTTVDDRRNKRYERRLRVAAFVSFKDHDQRWPFESLSGHVEKALLGDLRAVLREFNVGGGSFDQELWVNAVFAVPAEKPSKTLDEAAAWDNVGVTPASAAQLILNGVLESHRSWESETNREALVQSANRIVSWIGEAIVKRASEEIDYAGRLKALRQEVFDKALELSPAMVEEAEESLAQSDTEDFDPRAVAAAWGHVSEEIMQRVAAIGGLPFPQHKAFVTPKDFE